MRLTSTMQAGALAAAMTWAGGAGAATLVGTTVAASITTEFLGVSVSPGTATVGVGDEFTISLSASRGIFVDLDATTITLRYNEVSNAFFDVGNTILTLSNLAFGVGIGAVSVVQTLPVDTDGPGGLVLPEFFGGNTVTFDATSVSVRFAGLWSGDGSVAITLTERRTDQPPPVPLPAGGFLLLAALGALAALRRRVV